MRLKLFTNFARALRKNFGELRNPLPLRKPFPSCVRLGRNIVNPLPDDLRKSRRFSTLPASA
jgi:hypothetical protein